MEQNYYEILEVDKNASSEIIKKAYNTLAKKYHPDLQSDNLKHFYEEKFKLINEAYEVLSDEEKRKNYDETIKINTITKQEYEAICMENQQLRNTIIELQNELSFRNNNLDYISYNESKSYNNSFNNINNNQYSNQYNDDFNQYNNYNTNNTDDYKIKNKIKLLITIIIIMLILYLLWHIPFIQNLIKDNILLQTIFSFFSS